MLFSVILWLEWEVFPITAKFNFLQAEGIFRINAENGQEEDVREQLNSGVVPENVDIHCLAGLIKVLLCNMNAEIPFLYLIYHLRLDRDQNCNQGSQLYQITRIHGNERVSLIAFGMTTSASHHDEQTSIGILFFLFFQVAGLPLSIII